MDECEWTSCEALAKLDVLAGPAAAQRVGGFCIPHASLASSDVQERVGEPTWYDWHRPQIPTLAFSRPPARTRTRTRAPAVAVLPPEPTEAVRTGMVRSEDLTL